MKKLLSAIFILITILPAAASSRCTPLRYTEQPRNIKHAGNITRISSRTDLSNLNYRTEGGFNYKTGAAFNYNVPSGFQYKHSSNLRYR